MALPDHLADLADLFDEWSIDDMARRVMTLVDASDGTLHDLAEKVLPRAEAIDAYLETFGNGPFDSLAKKLMLLAETALDAETELEIRQNPGPIEE